MNNSKRNTKYENNKEYDSAISITKDEAHNRTGLPHEGLSLEFLANQINKIATSLIEIGSTNDAAGGQKRIRRDLACGDQVQRIQAASGHDGEVSMSDVQLLRKIIRQEQGRASFFDGELFSDPAWNMLLDLAAARKEGKRVSVTSLCIASGVPATTALRWINIMTERELLQRVEDTTDRRRSFIDLTNKAADAMSRYIETYRREMRIL